MVAILIKKINTTIDAPDYDDAPESSKREVWLYGMTQYLNDGHASVWLFDRNKKRNPEYPDTPVGEGKFKADVLAAANARVAKVRSGTMGVRGAADPFETVAASHGMTVDQLKAFLTTRKEAA